MFLALIGTLCHFQSSVSMLKSACTSKKGGRSVWTDEIDSICRMQLLPDLAERYILSCREEDEGKKKHRRFPNVAGFCRFFGINSDQLDYMKEKYPDSYSALCLIFEDEAFNAEISTTVLSAYLKKRLGYSERESAPDSTVNVPGPLKLIFEHDIMSDGE